MNFSCTRSSSLAQLRKTTGYSISNCKKALELYPDNVAKAEEWLHEEAKQKGWAKWAKIQSRSATQGLIGTYSKNTMAAMLEVNCETDFVSRNAEFQSFVEKVLISCMNHINDYNTTDDISKVYLDESQLNSLKFESTTVGELLAAVTCKFNEKTVTKRAVCYKAKESVILRSISHPGTMLTNLPGASIGKYGTIVAFKQKSNESSENLDELSRSICQHIIGMNPTSVGCFTEEDLALLHKKKEKVNIQEQTHTIENLQSEQFEKSDSSADNYKKESELLTSESDETSEQFEKSDFSADNYKKESESQTSESDETDESEDEDSTDAGIKDTDETRLLHQPFLLDSKVTVGETVLKSSIDVLQFERFECGESNIQESEAVAQSVKA